MLILATVSFAISLMITYLSGRFLWGLLTPPMGIVLFFLLGGISSEAPEIGLAMGVYMASFSLLASGAGALLGSFLFSTSKEQVEPWNRAQP
ncbi:hypothetical protein [Nitrosococcus watsonii]|uniref:Uncharacterized protein n=1 Tax=Nitrosococcus watsoni (strain C-113) TaxID=105559 RepID=D8K5U5_NITWC|nr:hypothetical protein [Nitrosococcus watsonii]ADJ28272.1 hypothetical protein Nwat_1354 [Nitrosococcus watsonii C-113]